MLVRMILLIFGGLVLGGLIFLSKDKKVTPRLEKDGFQKIIDKEYSKNNWLYDYDQYNMTKKEKFFFIGLAATALFIVGYIFYQSSIGGILLTPFALFYPSVKRKELIANQKKQLNLEFKEALYVISASLTVGKSIEQAIKDSIKELVILYPEGNTYIIKELEYITRKIDMNETVEEAFSAFSARTHLEDIENFVDVLITCKRTGGNLMEVMRNTSKMITEKIEFYQELDLMLTKRKFEQKFLTVIPVALVLILSWSAPDYMEPVFSTIIGRIVMTLSIGLLILSIIISKKIIQIEV